MTKRRRLVLESLILTLGFLATQFVSLEYRYAAILGLGVASYFLTALFLKDDLNKISWLVVLPPMSLYVIFASLFYFLLPQKIFVRILNLAVFMIGAYASLLTLNIFSIASKFKTIQLLRAAQAVGFIITLVTAFFGYNTLFSFRTANIINGAVVVLISFPLILSSLWSITLEETLNLKQLLYSLILSLIMGQLAFTIGFWPLTITTASLFLTSLLYVGLGIVQSFMAGKLFKNSLQEFIRIGIIIFIITFLLARWR
jgi:hypothetical protein